MHTLAMSLETGFGGLDTFHVGGTPLGRFNIPDAIPYIVWTVFPA